MNSTMMIKEILERRRQWDATRESDFDWLIRQAEMLSEISSRWIAIEEEGTIEEANDFYTDVQDILTEDY